MSLSDEVINEQGTFVFPLKLLLTEASNRIESLFLDSF